MKMEQTINTNEIAEVNANEIANVETPEQLTPEQEKAKQILRARLPKLAEAGLNFEKRTGNFFTASLEKVVETVQDADGNEVEKKDSKGNPVYVTGSDGKPVEKVRRLVVELTDANGNLLPEYAECADEIAAKRAAALVLDGEKRRVKLEAEMGEAEKRVRECADALATFNNDIASAAEIIATVELPEKTTRIAAVVKLQAVEDENAKLRAKLIAMGINPDELA